MWCLLIDGPLAGEIYELDVSARTIQIQGGDKEPGAHCYRRTKFGADDAHRIAFFKHTKTLVV